MNLMVQLCNFLFTSKTVVKKMFYFVKKNMFDNNFPLIIIDSLCVFLLKKEKKIKNITLRIFRSATHCCQSGRKILKRRQIENYTITTLYNVL